MKVICVLGMHRSGTSLLSRIINLLGVDLGPAASLMPATEANPAGYWESQAISNLNEELIEHLGGRWHKPPVLEPGWEHDPELERWRSRAHEVLREQFGDSEIVGWKDPRNSLLLPFWRTVVPVGPTIHTIRRPADVAASLAARDGFEAEHSAHLWLRYVAAGWHAAPDAMIVRHADLYEAPEAVARRIVEHAGLAAPDDDVLAKIAETVDPSLQRQRHVEAPLGVDMLLAERVYELVEHDDAAGAAVLLAGLDERWRDRAAADRRVVAETERRRTAEQNQRDAGHARQRAVDARQAAVDEQRRIAAELAAANEQAAAARGEVQRLTGDVQRLTGDVQRLTGDVQRRTTELQRLRSKRSVRLALKASRRAIPAYDLYFRLRDRQRQLRRKAVVQIEEQAVKVNRARLRATAEQQDALAHEIVASLPDAPRTTGPLVSVLILNRSGEHHLRRCMPGLLTTDYDNIEVVVVDNGSQDGSLAYLDSLSPPFQLTVLRNSENRTFSEGNNQALEAARGDLVLLLNNDIEPVEPGWLGRMVDTLLTSDATAVGARLIYPSRPGLRNAGDAEFADLSLQHGGITFVADDGVPRARNNGVGSDPQSDDAARVGEAPALTAACLLVRRTELEAVGGLTERYVYGTEDVDLCLKLRARGGNLVYAGNVVLWHHEYGTQNVEGRQRKRENRLHNRAEFVDQWAPRVYREVLLDKIAANGQWSRDPLHVAITLTRDDPDAGYGDWYTAHELGDALAELGWRVTYAERYGDHWYDLDPSVEVVISLLDALDLRRVPRRVTTIAWVRNWSDRWVEHPWFDDYDIVLASSNRTKEIIEERTSKVAHLAPLATNADRFKPEVANSALGADVLFVGNYWGHERLVVQALPAIAGSLDAAVYGKGWDELPAFAGVHRGFLPYERVPQAYAATPLVIDDTVAHVTKAYAAVNSRVFDALAAGALVLSDNHDGVREIFDDEFPTWNNDEDLARIATELMADPARRAALVERYRGQVLARHTYRHRAAQIRDVLRDWAAAPRLGIRVGIPRREEADQWGDYHYARALARQFERRGVPTRVHLLPEWDEPYAARDDVSLHLFGLSELRPRPAQLNVLWVISHPERVTPAMCDRYDAVLVASDTFAETLNEESSVPVVPLHQATDPQRFHPDPAGPAHQLLFVANSRKARRKIVDDLAGTDFGLAVYGANWTPDLIDPRYVVGESVPNSELNRYYASAAIVLNDHWPDMRAAGFFSNRLYDALASGAFVISDHVDGIEDEFDNGVVTYREKEELHRLVERYLADEEARRAVASRGRAAVLSQHTFGHRVDAMLEILQPLRRSRPPTVVPVANAS